MYIDSKNPALTSDKEVQKIIQPFASAFSLTHFRYMRVYKADLSRIRLANNPRWTEEYLLDGFYQYSFIERFVLKCKPGMVLHDHWMEDPVHRDMVRHCQRKYNYGPAIEFIFHCQDYVETYVFSSTIKNVAFYNSVINNRAVFDKFFKYFQFKAKGLIKKAYEDRFILPFADELMQPQPQLLSFNDEKSIEKLHSQFSFHQSNELDKLTKTERLVVSYFLEGLSAGETAERMCRTKHTVQKHLKNIREKLNINKMSKIYQFIEQEQI